MDACPLDSVTSQAATLQPTSLAPASCNPPTKPDTYITDSDKHKTASHLSTENQYQHPFKTQKLDYGQENLLRNIFDQFLYPP